jgi:metallo-beta-lactamase family protein
LSGHADQKELLEWIAPLAKSIKKVFLVHGEPEQSATLAGLLRSEHGLDAEPVHPGQSFDLG